MSKISWQRIWFLLGFGKAPNEPAPKAVEEREDEPVKKSPSVAPATAVPTDSSTILNSWTATSSWMTPDPEPGPKKLEPETAPETPAEERRRALKDDEVLYRSRRHVKYLLKHAKRQLIAAVMLLGVLTRAISASDHPPGWPLLVILGGLAVCGFFIYRSYYEWKHLILEITVMTTKLMRAESTWLMLGGGGGTVPSSRVHALMLGDKTVWELTIFRNSRTISIDTQVGLDEFLHDMTDVKDVKAVSVAVETLIAHYSY